MLFLAVLCNYANISPDAASTSFARCGKEKVRNIKDVEAEKLVPSPDSFKVTLQWCGPVILLSCMGSACMCKTLYM